MVTKKKPDVAELVTRYQKAREAGKRAYARSDRLIKELAEQVKPGEAVTVNEAGRKIVLHDKFAEAAERGAIWTPCAARRWDLEVIEP